METVVGETLKARGEVYGDYEGGNKFRTEIMRLIQTRHKDVHGEPMDLEHEYLIYDIVNKLSRLCVTPTHADSWLDIGGYSKLTYDIMMEGEK